MQKNDARTLENNSLVWHPEVAKCPFPFVRFEKYTASLIGENPDLISCPKILDWVDFKVVAIRGRGTGEIFVEVRVLLEGDALLVLEAAEVPKDLFHTCFFTKDLCYIREITSNGVIESTLTFNDVGTWVREGVREKKLGHFRWSFDLLGLVSVEV